MLSRSTLAHIYDNLKPKTTLPNGSTKRGPPIFRRVLPRSQGSGVFAGIAGTLIPIACFGNRASRSEACELAPERTRPVHFRSCTRCVPHLSARTSAIARGDIPTPRRPSQLGSGRAQSMLLRATGGTDVQRSPPANQTPRAIVEIKPSELETIFSKQFRLRNNSGTHVFTGPEFPYNRDIGTMMSSDFLPGDMWAVGIIMLRILSRDTAPWTSEQMEKAAMANSSQQDFWLKYLRCSGPPSADPVVLRAIDLVRGLLRADPAERLTCSAALAHPFLHRQ
jgi:hypothetical protein